MEENEDRCYLCGLADGLVLARLILMQDGQSSDEMDEAAKLVDMARVLQLFDLLSVSIEPVTHDLLEASKMDD